MGIERIEIEGFRSLKHVVWEPSNLNVLIGPNGSGKSNVLAALDVLSFAARNDLVAGLDAYGGSWNIAWNHQAGDLAWDVGVSPGEPVANDSAAPAGDERDAWTYQLVLHRREDVGEYSVKTESLHRAERRLISRDQSRSAYELEPSGPVFHDSSVEPHDVLLAICPRGYTAGANVVKSVHGCLAGARVYQDMPVGRGANLRGSAKSRREDWVEPNGQNLVSVIHTYYQKDEMFTQAVDDAMRAAFGGDFVRLITPPAEDTRVQLRLKWNSLADTLSATELSDGILRFLLLVTILSQPEPPPLIAIDEPETGLHPSMLPIIAEYAVEAARKTQVILTTHSPEMLDAFSVTDVVPKVTVAFWEDGQTVLKSPSKDRLEYWLKEYTLGNLMSSGELEGMAE